MTQNFMRTKPILPLVISMSVPMMMSMMIQSLYNIIDSMFVAKIGPRALTAVSLVFPMQSLVSSLGVGFGVGINAAVAYRLGARDREGADKAASQGLLFGVVNGGVLGLLEILMVLPFLRLFTTDEAVIGMGCRYAYLVLGFSMVVTGQIAVEKIFQSVGDMIVPMVCMAAGGVLNLILDPLMIFGIGIFPKMGVTGAAAATVIGQVVTMLLYIFYYKKKDIGVTLSHRFLRPDRDIVGKIYCVGIPATLTMALPSLLLAILNRLLSAYSQMYIIILGIYYKLQTFLYMPANGIVQGMRPIISYNHGAGEDERVKKTLRISMGLIAVIMLLGMAPALFLPEAIMGMFTEDGTTTSEGALALRTICLGFVVSSVSVVYSGALEALGKGPSSLAISLMRYFAVIVPAAFIGLAVGGVHGMWMAFPVAEFITAAASLAIFKVCRHRG